MKKVADSSDSEEEDKDDKSRPKKNKVSYFLFYIWQGIYAQVDSFRYRRKMLFQNTTILRIPSLTTLNLRLMNVNSSHRQSNKDFMFRVEK